MKTEIYLLMAFIWKYKDTMETKCELSLDESIYIAQEIVKDYLESGESDLHGTSEIDEFLNYVERNLTDYVD